MSHLSRQNALKSRLLERTLLNPHSSKQTYHLSLNLSERDLTFQPGDCLGIWPENDPNEVSDLMQALDLNSSESLSVRSFFLKNANIRKTHLALLKFIEEQLHHRRAQEYLSLENEKLSHLLASHTPLEILSQFPRLKFSLCEIEQLFFPMLPRLYSIASSPLAHPHEIHLIVALTSYETQGKTLPGVCSSFLCSRALIEEMPIDVYHQKTRSFLLPQDTNAQIIMACSGTGIAPFRAFLQHRIATQSKGANWLFFGERCRKTDFYYQDYFLELQKKGLLRLNLAFSRDCAEKIYVQNKLLEERKDLWASLRDNARLYICGSKEMAKDVDATLKQIAISEGGFSEEKAMQFFKELRHEKRYLIDIY